LLAERGNVIPQGAGVCTNTLRERDEPAIHVDVSALLLHAGILNYLYWEGQRNVGVEVVPWHKGFFSSRPQEGYVWPLVEHIGKRGEKHTMDECVHLNFERFLADRPRVERADRFLDFFLDPLYSDVSANGDSSISKASAAFGPRFRVERFLANRPRVERADRFLSFFADRSPGRDPLFELR
jgi:hypothetical protein